MIGPSAHKSIIQMQVTPQKFKIDFPTPHHNNTNSTKNTKLLTNKTIQEINNEAVDSLMLNIKFGKIQ
jgi:hypothetical protein